MTQKDSHLNKSEDLNSMVTKVDFGKEVTGSLKAGCLKRALYQHELDGFQSRV